MVDEKICMKVQFPFQTPQPKGSHSQRLRLIIFSSDSCNLKHLLDFRLSINLEPMVKFRNVLFPSMDNSFERT